MGEIHPGVVVASVALASWVLLCAWLAGDPLAAGGAVALLAGLAVIVVLCGQASANKRAHVG